MSVKNPILEDQAHLRARSLVIQYRDGGMRHVSGSQSDTPKLFDYSVKLEDEIKELWAIVNANNLNPHLNGLAGDVKTNASELKGEVVQLKPPSPVAPIRHGFALSPGWSDLSQNVRDELDQLLHANRKIEAIKTLRNVSGTSLNEAKAVIDKRAAELYPQGHPDNKSAGDSVSRDEFTQLANTVNSLAVNIEKMFTKVMGNLTDEVPDLTDAIAKANSVTHDQPCAHGEIAKPKEERPATPVEPVVQVAPPKALPSELRKQLKPKEQMHPLESPFVGEVDLGEVGSLNADLGVVGKFEDQIHLGDRKGKTITVVGTGDWMNTVQMFKALGGGNDPRNDGSKVTFRDKQLVYKSFRQQTPEQFNAGGLEVDLDRKAKDEPWLKMGESLKATLK